MSVLQTPQLDTETKLQQRATQIKRQVAMTGEQMFRNWSMGFDSLWRSDGEITPAQKIEALGTDAAEVFGLSAGMVTFMMNVFTDRRPDLIEKINAKLATLPEFTVNQDGTVTLA